MVVAATPAQSGLPLSGTTACAIARIRVIVVVSDLPVANAIFSDMSECYRPRKSR